MAGEDLRFEGGEFEAKRMGLNEEEPVAAPSYIATDGAVTGNLKRDRVGLAPRRHVVDGDGSIVVQGCADRTDRGVDGDLAGRQTTEVGE